MAVQPDADTMLGWDRLENIERCIDRILEDRVPGDFIETGVWRGGSCIFMAGILKARGVHDRRVWVADSFAGFPELDEELYPEDAALGPLLNHGLGVSMAVSLEEVQRRFRRYGLLSDQVRFLPGFFAQSLPVAP